MQLDSPMNLYLDDNMTDRTLAGLLRSAGHSVVASQNAGLVGRPDPIHFEYAIRSGLIVLTGDRDDFRDLHLLILTSGGNHPGVLVVRYENDAKRDMKPKHIAAAAGKVEKAGVPLVNEIIVLNHWR